MSVTESNIPCAPQASLSDVTNKYLILRGVENKKHVPRYLVAAQRAWKDVFQKTIYTTASKWEAIKAGDPYDYIDVPKNIIRFFSVNTIDDCGNIVSLYYDTQMNVIPEPTESSCKNGCGCGCSGGVCEDVNTMNLTTKLLFTISGVQYFEKKWTKYCKNGDVIEYTETPVKSYNDRRGSSGDFNVDYNSDYDIGSPGAFENMNVVYITSQNIICKLKVRPCGCPEDTEENEKILKESCGCFLTCCGRKRRCFPIFNDVNDPGYGSVKFSDCGTKIYFRPNPNRCAYKDNKLPTHLLLSYQVDGSNPSAEVMVPDYAETCIFSGIDYFTKRYNNSYSQFDKKQAEYDWENEKIEVIKYLNPISISFLKNIMDVPIRW